jgi:hypothetical protein
MLTLSVSFGLFSGCKSSKKAARDYPEPPRWIMDRPVAPGYYFGTGSAVKRGSSQIYRQRAADKALADIAGQISMYINSNVSMYRVEDKFGVREVFENRIKTESEDFLEGQELIDEYENEEYYYVLYRLSKETYLQKRNERRKKAMEAALQNYKSGMEKLRERDYQLSVRFFVKSIENITPFWGEKTTIVSETDTIDLFADPLEKLKSVSGVLHLEPAFYEVNSGNALSELFLTVTNHEGNPVEEVPLMFSLRGGYLISNRGKTDSSGRCNVPEMNIPESSSFVVLKAKVDYQHWINQSTENIEIRKLVKDWAISECEVVLRE